MNDKVDSNLDYLEMGGRKFSSRLFVGTGKFSSPEEMRYAIQASETEIVTVALRRVDLEKADDDILAAINREKVLLAAAKLKNKNLFDDIKDTVRWQKNLKDEWRVSSR